MRSYQQVRLHKSLVLVRKKELLDLSFHLPPIQEFSLGPHRQRDSHSALRSRNALATPTCQCSLARVAKQRGKRVRRQVMCRLRGDFCQRPYRYLGLPFVQPALQWSASISTMCKTHAADNAYLWHIEQVPTGLSFGTNLVQVRVIVDTVEG